MEDFGFNIAEEVIVRSNCVLKQCKPLISSTITVTSVPKLLIFSRSKNKCFSFHLIEQKIRVKSPCSPMEEHLLSCHRVPNIIAHSSCNGLLLIQIDNDLFVWNPLTKFFKKVLTYDDLNRQCRKRDSSAELCFDSSRDEYKVVLVFASRSYSCKAEFFYFAAFGATHWEKIEEPYTIDNVYLGTVFKGKKHWVCKSRLSHYDLDDDYFLPPNCIVYFNSRTNMFVEVPIPQPKKGDRDIIVGLGVLDSCLVMTRLDDHERKIEFLAMKEYGNENSWVGLFVISNVPEFRRNDVMKPLLKTKEGEVFVCMYKPDSGSSRDTGPSVKCYDVNRKILRDMLVSTENEFKVLLYEESLASPRVYDRNHDLWELEDSCEEEFQSRKKKKNKKIEKNHHRMKKKKEHSKRDHSCHASIEISIRRKGRKGSKRNYEPKCIYVNFPSQHDFSDINENFFQGETVKINRTRVPHISHKTSIIREVYTAMIGSYCDIAEDLLIEVLSRLPIKSLARFKCVSKQWQHLISNAITVKDVPKLLIFSRLKNECLSCHLLDQEIRIGSVYSPMEEQLLKGRRVKAHSSFNGFLLIQIDYDLVMWNPLTKFFRKVPTHTGMNHFAYHEADLCFDYANDEYKVVLVYYLTCIYAATCGANNWEELNFPITVNHLYQGPCFKGYRHWIRKGCYPPFHTSNGIVYFDPSTNDFIELATPQPKKDDTNTIVGLGVIDEYLCMTRWDGIKNYEGNTEFLVMKEYGNGDSWDIVFVISNVPEFRGDETMLPLFKTKDGEILVCTYQGRWWSVKAYDVNGKFLREILTSRNRSSFKILLYEKSLFSPSKLLEDVKGYV